MSAIHENPANGVTRREPAEAVRAMKRANQERLEQLEREIQDGLQTFVAVGLALREISELKLFLAAGYESFHAYAFERWGMSRTGAYKAIHAVRVLEVLESGKTKVDVLPANEAQACALVPLLKRPEEMRAVWGKVLAGEAKPSSPALRQAVRTHLTGMPPSGRKPRTPRPVVCPACSHEFVPGAEPLGVAPVKDEADAAPSS